MEIVRELGLITCERGEFGQGARRLIWRSASVFFCPGLDHMEEEVQVKVRVEVEREEQEIGETHGKEQGEKRRAKQHSNARHG